MSEEREHGDGSISERPNGRFQIQFYANGKKRRETYRTLAKAKKALHKRIAQRDGGTLDDNLKSKVDALADGYILYAKNSKPKSAYWIELVWNAHLEPFFGGYRAGRVGTDLLERYISERRAAGAATSTVNRELAILKAMFNMGAECDPPKVSRVPRFPAKLNEPAARSGFLSVEDYDKLQSAAKHDWLRGFLAVAYAFGFRKSELLGLRVSQVDMKAHTLRLLPGQTKNDRGRTVVMTQEVYSLLLPCVKGKGPEDHVFTWPDGSPVLDYRGSWRRLCATAGVKVLTHDFRRSAVRNMLRAGISKHIAKQISGHVTDSIFDRYDITDESDLTDAARKIETLTNGRRLTADKNG